MVENGLKHDILRGSCQQKIESFDNTSIESTYEHEHFPSCVNLFDLKKAYLRAKRKYESDPTKTIELSITFKGVA